MNHTASVPARDEWARRVTTKGLLDRVLGALIVVWLILAVAIGRRFHRMAGESRTPNTS
jgi:hypothetical protein